MGKARAQHDDAVRDDGGVADVLTLVAGTYLTMDRHGGDAGLPDRVSAVVFDGLRPMGSRAPDAPTREDERAERGAGPAPRRWAQLTMLVSTSSNPTSGPT